ncbi:MAG: ABC transporter permease [Muribaculaceae bacterium]|nr:ABC transporter permease [Muribaculaceae bacterium]
MKSKSGIFNWFDTFCKVWRREFRLVISDPGVMLFFFGLPLLYPIVYTLIYNPEVITNLPIAVVDHSRTAESRELARMVDATQGLMVYDYCPDIPAARRLSNEKKVFGVLEIPADYAKRLGRGEQAHVTYYSDMSLLLRYRTALSALTEVQLSLCDDLRGETVSSLGLVTQSMDGSPIAADSVMTGDPTQGFASFIIPGIIILILQQSMILGITMLAGGSSERRRRNRGYDPLAIDAGPATAICAKTLCYLVCYVPMTLYVLHIVPVMFSLPHVGSIWHSFVFVLPMLLASAMLGQFLGVFVTERESSLLVVVFTSIIFLFLSGLTWPRYAMSPFWKLVGDAVPATWGMEGFIRINSNGATVGEQHTPYIMLWVLTGVYFVATYVLRRINFKGGRLKSVPSTPKN